MAFIDEIQFHAKAGNGGDGVVRWRHEKSKEYSGAAGGNGGPGGDVYVRAVRDINILSRHKSVKHFLAKDGEDGSNLSCHGSTGDDKIIDLPLGALITNLSSKRVVELIEEGQLSKILHGGRGGLGNEHFKASTNVKPEQCTPGMPGEAADFSVELNLIADAGFIGLPNAGKSSLLNAITRARAKVGSYAFTTLDPNLGAVHGYVLADIPGIIEGAAEGKGLGHKFLRHVKRTKLLLHLVSLESEDIVSTYKTIRQELEKYGHGLPEKREIIVLTKTDLVDVETIKAARKAFSEYSNTIWDVNIYDDDSLKLLTNSLVKELEKEVILSRAKEEAEPINE
jgi:GTPase